MTITVSTESPRTLKALELLQAAATWQTGRTKQGRSFYAVPASDGRGFHMTDTRGCSCTWAQRTDDPSADPCSHILAVRLHVARLKGRATRRPSRHTAEQVAAGSAAYVALFGEEA